MSVKVQICPHRRNRKHCRYDANGFVEELPKLPEGREEHACAALHGVRVSSRNQPNIFPKLQAGPSTHQTTP